ncbi:MAG: type II secretion system F family protein [Sulfurimonas sp.]
MKYFNVTLMEKGKKRKELTKAANKMAAIQRAKQKFSSAMVIKAEETVAPMEETLKAFFSGLTKSMKKKIPINDKISTIRQIAVMTDAGIPINDTLQDVGDNTRNQALKDIYISINNDINAGGSMSDSMKKYKEEFGHVALAMTEEENSFFA